jgi:putative NIF3 family GTP cyclohydrolase 1 type 2
VTALLQAHPYEEVAYDIYTLDNEDEQHGIGMIGELKQALGLREFLTLLKETFSTGIVRHTASTGEKMKRIAVCGGSGSFLIDQAIREKADVFVTSDIKYHQFFDAEESIVLADIGHYESESFTAKVIGDFLKENFTTFATHFSRVNTNPIKYF